MSVPVTVAMGNAYYVFFVPMVIATRMPMPTVMGSAQRVPEPDPLPGIFFDTRPDPIQF